MLRLVSWGQTSIGILDVAIANALRHSYPWKAAVKMFFRFFSLLIVSGCVWTGHAFAQTSTPNVLLMIADDLGSDSLNLFSGIDGSPTPTLDSLANTGVRFTNCWGSPSCAPARAQILTGRYGFRTGVGHVGAVPALDEGTIAQAFQTGGYATGCFGKWHLANATNGNRDNPNLMGFDHYSGNLGGGVQSYFSWTKVTNGAFVNNANNPETNYATSQVATEASTWIQQRGNEPWFCWVAFNAPHLPFHLPPSNLHSSNLSGTNADIATNPRAYYLAMVEAMDTEIGRILEEMNPTVRDNTVVVFVGDNGTPGQAPPNTRIFNGSKGSLFEGGVRIPCIVSGSNVQSPGRTNDGLVSLVDLFTTLLDLAGLNESLIPDGAATDSQSFASHLSDPNAPIVHTCQFSERFEEPSTRNDGKTLKLGDWKLIRNDNGAESFFNLPDEDTNLADGSLTPMEQTQFELLNNKLDNLLSDALLGDVNRDEAVGFSDIPPFISLLISGTYQLEADCNQNGLVDFADIPVFINILIGQ